MAIFTSQKLSEHLTRIMMPCGVCAYLVQGRTGAALLDTGFGFGDLKAYVETLTRLPLIVLLSHGHLDHAGGASQFATVYLNERDWDLERWHCTLERRINDVKNGPGGMPSGVTESDFLPSRTAPYQNYDEGDDFNLGGVMVRPIAVPSHTKGSMVFLLPEDRIAIFGDSCGEHTLLHFDESEPIVLCREAYLHLQQYASQFDTVLRYHGNFVSQKKILADSIELCDDVLAGRDAAIPVTMMGRPGCKARPESHPGKEGNLIYDPQKRF